MLSFIPLHKDEKGRSERPDKPNNVQFLPQKLFLFPFLLIIIIMTIAKAKERNNGKSDRICEPMHCSQVKI